MFDDQKESPNVVTIMKSETRWVEIGFFVKNIYHLKDEMSRQKFFHLWPQLFCSKANIEKGLQDIYEDYTNLRDDMMFLGLHENDESSDKENDDQINNEKVEKEVFFVSNDYQYANKRPEKNYFKLKNELINFLARNVDSYNKNNYNKQHGKTNKIEHSTITLTTHIQRRQINVIAKLVYFEHNTHVFGW